MLKKLIASGVLSVFALAIAAFLIPSVSAADDANQDKGPAIRMVALNKGAFKAGEEVYALVRWSAGDLVLPSKGSQVSGKASVINVTVTKGDKLCADPAVLTLFSGGTEAYLPIKATADCISPTVRAMLIDADGRLVSERMVMVAGGVEVASGQTEGDGKADAQATVPAQKDLFRSVGFVIAITLAAIGVIAILVVLIRRRSMAKKLMAFIFAFGISAIVSGAYVAEAQWSMAFPPLVAIYLDKNLYNSGETITVTGEDFDCQSWVSSNSYYTDIAVSLQGSKTQVVGPIERVGLADRSKCIGKSSVTAPMVPGAYKMTVYIRKYSYMTNMGYDPMQDIPLLMVNVVTYYGFPDLTAMVTNGDSYAGGWGASGGITYDGVFGGYAQYTIPITVTSSAPTPPTLSFSPDSYSISSGTSTNLHWTATNATSCTASGSWSGAKAVSGTESTGILSTTQVYFLSCTGPGGTSPLYTVPLTVIPITPTIDLKVNGSDGPVTLASGATKNLSWAATNATSCTASGVDAFTGSKSVPNGSETLTVSRTSTDMLTCTGPGGTASDSVQINATCTPSTGAWGACDCSTETKTRTNINASCLPWTESDVCTIDEKNGCRDFNWKEVAP